MADVFLHVGLPKTGTTTLQAELEQRGHALVRAGVLFPGGRHHAQRLAAYDLLGQRVRGDDPGDVPGAFRRLVAEMDAFTGRSIVVSEEELGLARPRHVRRLARSLKGHRLFVIVTVRDLARTLVSAWQQSVVMGGTCSWQSFIEAARDPGRRSQGIAFWLRHDILRVLDAWGCEVPPERIRLVTVPPSGAPSETLLLRFASAAELPPGIWAGGATLRNTSFDAAALEVLRRLNEKVLGPLTQGQYRHVVEQAIRPGLGSSGSRPLVLPPEHLGWARQRSVELVAELERRGHPVYGDLEDLLPAQQPVSTPAPDDLTDAELLAAAEAELCAVVLAHGRLYTRYRRAFIRQHGRIPTPGEVVGSTTRAAVFGLQKRALSAADHRVVNWAARAYLRRS